MQDVQYARFCRIENNIIFGYYYYYYLSQNGSRLQEAHNYR
jgi:hypothetical protein